LATDPSIGSAEAKRLLLRTVSAGNIEAARSPLVADFAQVRRAFPADDAFTEALLAVRRAIVRAAAAPDTYGRALEHNLAGWRRSKFRSGNEERADMRIVFKARKGGGITLLAFGHREKPESIYLAAASRVP
jgi:hypothetical protein